MRGKESRMEGRQTRADRQTSRETDSNMLQTPIEGDVVRKMHRKLRKDIVMK